MRKLDFNEYKICQIQGRLFEKSIECSKFSSPMFIRRFMTSEYAKTFANKSYLIGNINEDEIIDELNIKYQSSTKKPMYTVNEMYWIGYVYASISFLYEMSPKQVYKLFSAKEIVKYYNIYHTFGIEEASERMMESIGYENVNYTKRGVEILKRLYLLDELKKLIGQEVTVDFNNKQQSYLEKVERLRKGILQNYHIKEKEQPAYVYGENSNDTHINGRVVGIVYKNNESLPIVVPQNVEYNQKEFERTLILHEKVTKYKILK